MTREKKVNFLICGTQKGGTTAPRTFLRKHSSIEMPEDEIHYFDNDEYFDGKDADYATYHSHFSNDDPEVLWGETTPIYMYWKPSPKRIYEYNPEMKLIMLLRDPIERAYSHWNMEFKRGKEELSFEDAISQEGCRLMTSPTNQHRVYSYVDRGHYLEQLNRIFSYFDNSQTLILNSLDLLNKTSKTMEKITTFLGISKLAINDDGQSVIHSGEYETEITNACRRLLEPIFREDLSVLENTLGVHLAQ